VRRPVGALVCVVALVACSDDGGSAEELCRALREDPSIANAFTGFDPTDTPAALDQLRTARVTLGELRDAAPSEVRDDLTVEIDYVQDLIDGLSAVEGGDAADAVAVVQRVTADHPDVADAAAELQAYAASSCG
jgi:hypothetical protein